MSYCFEYLGLLTHQGLIHRGRSGGHTLFVGDYIAHVVVGVTSEIFSLVEGMGVKCFTHSGRELCLDTRFPVLSSLKFESMLSDQWLSV